MAVLLANCRLGVRRKLPEVVDGHGMRRSGGHAPMVGPRPGRANEGPELPGPADEPGSRSWTLALDPGLWPVERDDLVVDPDGGREWLVLTADLHTNAADPAVDYVAVTAHIRQGGGTRP